MSRAVSPSVDRVYGLVRVARCWNVSRGNRVSPPAGTGRPETPPGPVGPCDDATLLQHIQRQSPRAASRRGLPQDLGRGYGLPASAAHPGGCGA